MKTKEEGALNFFLVIMVMALVVASLLALLQRWQESEHARLDAQEAQAQAEAVTFGAEKYAERLVGLISNLRLRYGITEETPSRDAATEDTGQEPNSQGGTEPFTAASAPVSAAPKHPIPPRPSLSVDPSGGYCPGISLFLWEQEDQEWVKAARAEAIDGYLADYGSSMAGMGRVLVESESRYNYWSLLLVGIAYAESSLYAPGQNPGGLNAWGACFGWSACSSWEQSVDQIMTWIRHQGFDCGAEYLYDPRQLMWGGGSRGGYCEYDGEFSRVWAETVEHVMGTIVNDYCPGGHWPLYSGGRLLP